MEACLDDVSAVLDREFEALKWLRSNSAGVRALKELYDSAEKAVFSFKKEHGMSAHLQWSVMHADDADAILEIHVGGLIELKDEAIDNMTYSLCVVRKTAQDKKLIRKYHFDYANRTIRASRRSSVFHLQYGGKLAP
jgi:hypothetical protein